MSLARVHTWIAAEVLTASDLNAEFNNIITNASSLFSPFTADTSTAGFKLYFDAGNSIYLNAVTNGLSLVGGAFNTPQGADIASAATVNLDTATGNLVDVTGTSAITAITLSQGRMRVVRFTGSLLLTYSASLVLPDSTSIQTAAGDYAIFQGYASSVVRCVMYSRLQNQGTDVASASTLNLDTATGEIVDVTGTTSITAVTLAQGRKRNVRFTGATTLTNGASLVLPTGANILTKAGDFAEFIGYASSIVRCSAFTPAVGLPTAFKVVNTTFDCSSATGTFAVTGAGFKPRIVVMLNAFTAGSVNGSIGWSDGTTEACLANYGSIVASQWAFLAGFGYQVQGGSVTQTFSIATGGSLDADGCTVKNTKVGSPGGTVSMSYLFIR